MMVTLGEKEQEVQIETIPLVALQEIRRERGLLQEILDRATEENRHDFLSVTLTDEIDPYKPKDQLEEQYDFILELMVDNARTKARIQDVRGETSVLDPYQAFLEFYQEMQQCSLSSEEEHIVAKIIGEASKED
jgi:exonuclease SbcD